MSFVVCGRRFSRLVASKYSSTCTYITYVLLLLLLIIPTYPLYYFFTTLQRYYYYAAMIIIIITMQHNKILPEADKSPTDIMSVNLKRGGSKNARGGVVKRQGS